MTNWSSMGSLICRWASMRQQGNFWQGSRTGWWSSRRAMRHTRTRSRPLLRMETGATWMPPPPSGRTIQSTTCCSFSRGSCFEPLYQGICRKLSPSTIKTPSRWMTCTKWWPTPRGNLVPKLPGRWQPSMRTATLRPRTTKKKSLPSRTGETQNSRTDRRNKTRGLHSAAIILVPALEATQTGTANTAFTASSRTTPKMNAGKESGKINHAETNKDVPTGPKCMWPATAAVNTMEEINRDSSRVFPIEPDDPPYPGSQHHPTINHPTINPQFMYNFNCNL